jgi:hypothetical protein
MSGISDFDRAHIADILAGEGDWFTAHLLRLIAKADAMNRAKLKFMYSEEVEAFEEWEQRGAPQGNLRLVPMANHYWHVVSNEPASIIGSLLYASGSRQWRAEFSGTIDDGWSKMEVGYFETEEEALAFMEEALRSHLAEAAHE